MKKHISFIRKLYVSTSKLFNSLVSPKSDNYDIARREFVLNVIILGIIFVTFIALLHNIEDFWKHIQSRGAITPIVTFSFLLIFLFLYKLSRIGKSKFVAEILIITFSTIPFYTIYKWGIEVPAALLAYALIIVMSGILINSKLTFIMTGIIVLIGSVITYLQSQRVIIPDYTWKQQPEIIGDMLTYGGILALISVISWLFNRQSEIAFKRATKMEMILKKERDSLEQKVEERTREIKQVQLEKLTSLNHMAEIGRLTAGFFHDLVNPLNLVSLNLDELSSQNRKFKKQTVNENKIILDRAIKGTKRMLQFVNIARQQIRDQQIKEPIDLIHEINDVIVMLNHKAKNAKVNIIFNPKYSITIFGNPLRFNQIVSNLISNAIDAYDNRHTRGIASRVVVRLLRNRGHAFLIVKDFGMGIPKDVLPKIYIPFYTTKKTGKDIGIGLSICKDIVEHEFNGEIAVQSQINVGTVFTVKLPIKQRVSLS
jgi:signal transduction histidine kinase